MLCDSIHNSVNSGSDILFFVDITHAACRMRQLDNLCICKQEILLHPLTEQNDYCFRCWLILAIPSEISCPNFLFVFREIFNFTKVSFGAFKRKFFYDCINHLSRHGSAVQRLHAWFIVHPDKNHMLATHVWLNGG